MKNKYLAYTKNILITSGVSLLTGAAVAGLTRLVTDNDTTISVASTVSEYVAAYSTFLPLHKKNNKDIYYDEQGKFKRKEFYIDQVKLTGAFFVIDAIYLIGKPLIMRKMLNSGVDSSTASIYTDAILFPALIALSVPLAKISGNIRSKSSKLEEEVKNNDP